MTYEAFLTEHRARLLAGLVAGYGPEVGQEVTAEAVAYGWQHWDRLRDMDNPVGYLYRVGQSAARRQLRPAGYLPARAESGLPEFEPGLGPALESLSEQQRLCVVLVHGLGWSQTEVAELLGVSVSSVRTHLARALSRLRTCLNVPDEPEPMGENDTEGSNV